MKFRLKDAKPLLPGESIYILTVEEATNWFVRTLTRKKVKERQFRGSYIVWHELPDFTPCDDDTSAELCNHYRNVAVMDIGVA